MKPPHGTSISPSRLSIPKLSSRPWVLAKEAFPYLLAFTLGVATIVGLLRWLNSSDYKEEIVSWREQLSGIADDQAQRVSDWLKERQGDAKDSSARHSVRAVLRDYNQGRQIPKIPSANQSELLSALDDLATSYSYAGVYILDRDAHVVMQSSRSIPLNTLLAERCRAVARSGVARTELVGDAPAQTLVGFIAPVFAGPTAAGQGQPSGQPLGIVLLVSDASQTLFPLVTRELVPTRTGETVLVRREGQQIVFFSPLQHAPAGSSNLRFPLSAAPIPARLSLEGRQSFVEYNDYRGVPVLAATQYIPLTGWGLVRKIDRSEALEDFRRMAMLVNLAGGLLIILLAGLLLFLRRYTIMRVRKREEEKFRALLESAPDAIYILEPSTLRILGRNRRAVEMDGYSDEEISRMTATDLHPPEEHAMFRETIARGSESGGVLPLHPLHHRRKNGQLVPVEENQTLVDAGSERLILSLVHDISERKRAEEELQRINRALRTISDCNQALVRAAEEPVLLKNICEILVRVGSYRMAWVGFAEHDYGKSVRPVAHSGYEDGYLETARISWADTERGRGPTGTAVRTAKPVVVRFIQQDPNLAPWRKGALKRGYASSIALPILANEHVLGALTIYSAEPDAFDSAEVQLLSELADDLAYGIQTLRTKAERGQAEEALTEERHLLHTLMDNLPDWIYFKDRESRFTRINMSLAEKFGLDHPAQATGKTDLDFMAPEHAREFHNDDAEVLKTGQSIVGKEESGIWPDGHVTWISTTKMPVRDPQGNIIGTFGVSRDITERKQFEEALRESEEKYRSLVSNIPDVTWTLNANQIFVFISSNIERLSGFSPDEIYAHGADLYLSSLHPDDVHKVRGALRALFAEGRPYDVECRVKRKDGDWVWVHDRALATYEKDGIRYADGLLSDITDRKRMEETLRLTQFSVEHASDGTFWMDSQGCIVYANEAACRSLGRPREELTSLSISNIDPLFKTDAWGAFWEELKARGSMTFETQHQTKQGRIFPVEVTANHVEFGGMEYSFAFARDITKRKQADEALRESEERFRQITETIDEVFWTADPNISRMLYISPAYERVWDRSRTSLYENPRSFLESIHPDDRARVLATLETQKSGQSFEHEYRIVRSGGSIRWIWDRGFPVRDAAGQLSRYVGVAVDITERKRSEAEHIRLVTAIEQSAEAVVITDTHGEIEYVNPAFTRITGYSREEALEKNPRILKSGKHDLEFYRQLWETILNGTTWHGEVINRRKNGSLYTEQMSITPIRDEAGKITHFISTKLDVTERKALETQLQQAAKIEAVGRLAGGIAHDFNNLLTVINGYSELLGEKLASDAKSSIYLKEIFDAGQRAASLTRQLLAFSRRQVLAPQVLDMNVVVSNLEKMLRRLIGEDIKLNTLLDPSLHRVKADPGQIEQVIMNLAVNARDAMPTGGQLTLQTRNVELDGDYARSHPTVKPGPHVMLAVSDTGMGMSPETMARIFEPFFTTKEMGKGTGLGLATVYGIIKQSGGSIWVYSEPGEGTVFKVYFPIVTETPAPTEQVKAETGSHAGTETILVVEDEEGVRSLVQVALTSSGYKVLETESAKSALATCARYDGPIHLLLTDVVMPQMSGPRVAEQIAALRPDIKVIYMSGYTDDAVVRHGVLSQDMPFIQKPFSPAALRKKIREVLDGK